MIDTPLAPPPRSLNAAAPTRGPAANASTGSWLERWSRLRPMLDAAQEPGDALDTLVRAGLDRLPRPGEGDTLSRWRALAEVAAHDLSLAKLFEGHTDALAILHELDAPAQPPGALWGVWCAEPPQARLRMHAAADETVRLSGPKAWCSGAARLTHAVVSAWDDAQRPCLAVVALRQPGVQVTQRGWHAVGMAATASVDVAFDGARALALGAPGRYTARAGFWRGGAGIAACWWGGAVGLARAVRAGARAAKADDPHRLAHLGAIDALLASSGALLRESAQAVDAAGDDPQRLHTLALRVRLAVEASCARVIEHAGRAIGAGPMCRDPDVARRFADLPVFLRQSHAERDLEVLGRQIAAPTPEPASWRL